jgi:pSer/pThr/pTyr-binding forkhead associated (FHA) protein
METPSSPTGRVSPGGQVASSPTGSRLQWGALLGRRQRSNTGPYSPTSDTDTGRPGGYFRTRIRGNSVGQPQPQPDASTQDAMAEHSIRLVPHLELSSRSLHFEPVSKMLTPILNLKVGRFNERATTHAAERPDGRVTFKSKVVSRTHAEVSVDAQGRFWVKDTKSSSGTFLNHIRLSGPGLESRPYPLVDGDVLQLGVDYQGGTEEIYRCVKIKVELNRGAPKASHMFKCVLFAAEGLAVISFLSAKAAQQLKALGAAGPSSSKAASKVSKPASSESTDCCICSFSRCDPMSF